MYNNIKQTSNIIKNIIRTPCSLRASASALAKASASALAEAPASALARHPRPPSQGTRARPRKGIDPCPRGGMSFHILLRAQNPYACKNTF